MENLLRSKDGENTTARVKWLTCRLKKSLKRSAKLFVNANPLATLSVSISVTRGEDRRRPRRRTGGLDGDWGVDEDQRICSLKDQHFCSSATLYFLYWRRRSTTLLEEEPITWKLLKEELMLLEFSSAFSLSLFFSFSLSPLSPNYYIVNSNI